MELLIENQFETMENRMIISQLTSFFPIIIERNYASEDEIVAYYNDYLMIHNRDNHIPMYFFDWLELAEKGQAKAKAFLAFCQDKIKHLSEMKNIADTSLKEKVRRSVLTVTNSGYPSYRDALGELLLFEHLCSINNYECIGIDFGVGNGRDSDIAFRKDNQIQLIEVTNIHKLQGKDLSDALKLRVEEKLERKTQNMEEVNNFFSTRYANVNVTLSILPFIWEDYFAIEAESDAISTVLEEKMDDILPPMTLLCEQINESEEYHYQVCSLAYVLDRIKELKNK